MWLGARLDRKLIEIRLADSLEGRVLFDHGTVATNGDTSTFGRVEAFGGCP